MKRLTKRSFLAALVPALALPLVITGCGGNNTEGDGGSPQASSSGSGSSGGKQYKLAFVTNNASDFWTYARRGTEKADKELNDVTVCSAIPAKAPPPSRRAPSTTCFRPASTAWPSARLIRPTKRKCSTMRPRKSSSSRKTATRPNRIAPATSAPTITRRACRRAN